ncbi:hypothetical protein M404DRAFT_1004270 [Pisolithus tinctorius Marx 270]|uniref:Uncharacterized protein n=1 Tax=Pisolithus tinctorius Marx 270 TaxID=870435 RepID=A0A0C3NXA9_PISTI|nr:hypothetical protein M404DRAFT_1004270 [Pisolithus tinctorius Marx 270]
MSHNYQLACEASGMPTSMLVRGTALETEMDTVLVQWYSVSRPSKVIGVDPGSDHTGFRRSDVANLSLSQ